MVPLKVTLCLGSSCHSRGNRRHVESLRQTLVDRGTSEAIHLTGSLCLGRCAEGPVVLLDGEVQPLTAQDDLAALVAHRLQVRHPQ